MSLYPTGYIKYFFTMFVDCDSEIFCDLVHPVARRIVLEKLNHSDAFCPEWQLTIHFGPVVSIENVVEAGGEIKEKIFNTLTFKLNTKISAVRIVEHGLEPRNGEGGILNAILPSLQCNASGRSGCMSLSKDSIEDIQRTLSGSPDFGHSPTIGLFRHAVSADDPVVQFLCLYLIFDVSLKKQLDIDRQIVLLEPTIPLSPSPHGQGKMETVYTRLRNEFVHRADVNPQVTRGEIESRLDSFRRIVRKFIDGEGSAAQ